MPTDPNVTRSLALARMPLLDFIARWRWIVGEPPAAMLQDRSAMIALLVESTDIVPLPVADWTERSDRRASEGSRSPNTHGPV